MSMTVLFKADLSRLDLLDKIVTLNVAAATSWLANELVWEIRNNWSPESPSTPGEAPAVKTGRLDASVVVESTGRDVMGRFSQGGSMRVVRIGAPYAGDLEHGNSRIAARPFVLPAVLRVAERAPEAYRDVISFKTNTRNRYTGEEE